MPLPLGAPLHRRPAVSLLDFRPLASLQAQASPRHRPSTSGMATTAAPARAEAGSQHSTPPRSRSRQNLDDRGLAEYIAAGPLAALSGLTPEAVEANLGEWRDLGDVATHSLKLGGGGGDKLSGQARARIFHYYLPVFFWCRDQVRAHREAQALGGQLPRPLFIGMQAPQGCGKTTLVAELEELFAHCGLRAASVSLDDFYLPFAEQQRLSKENPENRLWEVRGNAGTHDLQLARDTLSALRSATTEESQVALPRYNKAAQQGKGDRYPRGEWPQLHGRVDVVLFEGWMLGFRPQPEAAVTRVDPALGPINERLRGYQAAMDAHVDAWLVVRVADPLWVHRWRLQAEKAQRKAGRGAMSDKERSKLRGLRPQVGEFVDRYMPAYRAYLADLYAHGPTTAQPGKLLMVEIEESRALSDHQVAPPM